MTDWFTSDQHYGHKNVITYCNRPWNSIEEMDEGLIQNHNSVVKPGDRVFIIGDFSLSMKWIELYAPRLVGDLYLIPGNHDWLHSCHKNSENRMNNLVRRCAAVGLKVLSEQVDIELGDVRVLLSHLPYWEETDKPTEKRYKEFRPIADEEYALLCGHVHQYWKIRRTKDTGRIMYNVGVDVQNYAPVSAEKIFEDINDFLIREEHGEEPQEISRNSDNAV